VGRPITVGKSMAMRREDLERVGGWESVAGVLAEDDVLGQRFHAMGYAVEICLEPIENPNISTTLAHTMDRHARWAKMRRSIVPGCFLAEPLLWPLLVATFVAVLSQSALAMQLWACALGLQVTGALLCFTLLRARRPLLLAALEPLRTAVAFACWCLACTSRKVGWRGSAFALGVGSRLTPIEPRGRAGAVVDRAPMTGR